MESNVKQELGNLRVSLKNLAKELFKTAKTSGEVLVDKTKPTIGRIGDHMIKLGNRLHNINNKENA